MASVGSAASPSHLALKAVVQLEPPWNAHVSLARSNLHAAEPPQQDVLAETQHDEVGDPVPVDIKGICAGHSRQIGCRIRELAEPQRAADLAVVVIESRRTVAAREVKLGQAVAVTVERRHTSTHEALVVVLVDVLDARRCRLCDEMRDDAGVLALGWAGGRREDDEREE